MNILIVGGEGTFLNNILVKCYKEGHKASVLTGSRFTEKDAYQKCFEVYQFSYDASCLNDIFESAAPDVTIFMGAYDTNFKWVNEESDAVKYTASLANVLMGYVMYGKGRFIYLSSEEVFGVSHKQPIEVDEVTSPIGFRAQALYQGELFCDNYRKNRELDIMTVRLDHLYGIPYIRKDVTDICTKMCLSALEDKVIYYYKQSKLSLLYEGDAVEALHSLICAKSHRTSCYQISSETAIEEEVLAEIICAKFGSDVTLVAKPQEGNGTFVLSNKVYESEFGNPHFTSVDSGVERVVASMKKNPYVFVAEEEALLPLEQRLKKRLGWFLRAVIPFVENLVFFVPVYGLNHHAGSSTYFANLDFFLLYVLLFAVIFGQQQATISALLAVIGFCVNQMASRSGFDLFLDANTYVWVAQLFIVGLTVGYMRDQIIKLKKEQKEERRYLEQQIEDIQSINSTNTRVKNVLENQLINQTDSVGKIYSITSSLDHYSPEEVLFYAAETVSQIMRSDDVAIYVVSGPVYARLFSSTSQTARQLGNSIKFTEMGEVYETLAENHVYINRKMDSRYPDMSCAISEGGAIQILIMVWGLSWENMTLGQANQLSVVSSLIQNSVLRANRYLVSLRSRRYLEGTEILNASSFRILAQAFMNARQRGLNQCSIIQFPVRATEQAKILATYVMQGLRSTDDIGVLEDGNLYALLSNADDEAVRMVIGRFHQRGITCNLCKGLGE